MAIALPTAIELYFSSENAHDPALLEQCVASDALVRDEHKTIRGLEAIKAWRASESEHSSQRLSRAGWSATFRSARS